MPLAKGQWCVSVGSQGFIRRSEKIGAREVNFAGGPMREWLRSGVLGGAARFAGGG